MANKKIKFELTAVNKTKAAFDKVGKQLKTMKSAGVAVAKAMVGIAVAITGTALAIGALLKKTFDFIYF